jgi:hypothetical protein
VKTISLKKVSAVAVASLGFGLLSVVPAHAGNPTVASGVTHSLSTATTSVALGATATTTYTVGGTHISSAAFEVVQSETYPVGTAAGQQGATAAAGSALTLATLAAQATAGGDLAPTLTGAGTFAASTVLSITPTVAGIYRVVLTPNIVKASSGATGAESVQVAAVTWTIFAGYDAGGTVNVRKATPIQGSNTTTGWAASAGGQATVRITGMAASSTYFVTTDTGAILSGTGSDAGTRLPVAATVTLTNGTNLAGGFNFATSAAATTSDHMDVKVTDTGSPATTTVSVKTFDATTGASSTFVAATVTWGVAAAPSAQYSLLTLNAGTGTTASGAAADTTVTSASSSVSSGAAERYRIQVVVKDQYDVAYTGATLAAKLSGTAGSLGISGTANSGGAVAGSSISAAMTNASVGSISVFSNGVAGAATITITATTPAGVIITLGTKTVTFVGSASKATVTQNLFVAKAGTQLGLSPATTKAAAATTVATTPALTAVVTDSAGVEVTSVPTVKIESSDSTVIVAGTCVALSVDSDPTSTTTASPGTFECPVSGAVGAASGKSATITFSVYSSTTGLYSIVATPITFTIGGAIAKSVIATDKATYTAGEAMTLLATSTDSAGNKAYDGQTPYASISANRTFGGSLPATTKEIVNGSASTTSSKGVASLFAPATPGSFTISGLYTDAATGTAYSATGAVADGNAALLTQIDALNAKIVALNALIAKIMKKLGVK